jgi:hypothetical protein
VSEIPAMLAGLVISEPVTQVQLRKIGETLIARRYGLCRLCQKATLPGWPIAECPRYGWVHEECLLKAQAEGGEVMPDER